LASPVAGRGADFMIQSEIASVGGALHVLITYHPKSKRYSSQILLDAGAVTQMISFAGRMDKPGSHSILTRNARPLPDEIKLYPIQAEFTKLAIEIFKIIGTLI